MYLPEHFREARAEPLESIIRRHPLATLIAHVDGTLSAEHLPLQLHVDSTGAWCLRGHLARANPLWRRLSGGSLVLTIFQNAGRYISPTAYPSKREHGRVVPTWNYAAVHLGGRIRFIEDPAWLRALVDSLTDTHEAARSPPWRVSDAPEEFITAKLAAIVGFEITVLTVTGKLKASQNRTDSERAGVRAALQAEGLSGDELDELVRDPQTGS